MSCKLWRRFMRDDDNLPIAEPDPPIDFINVIIDSKLVEPAREDGAGPNGTAMRPDEDVDVLRELYVPRDGEPHAVQLQFRQLGQRSYVRQVDAGRFTVALPVEDDAGFFEPPLVTPAERDALNVKAALGHAAGMGAEVVNMAQMFVKSIQGGARQQMETTSTMVAAFLTASSEREARAEERAARAEERTAALLNALATQRQDSGEAMRAALAAQAERPSIIDQALQFAPIALPWLKAGWDKLGGLDGVLGRFINVAGAAGEEKGKWAFAIADRFAEALETSAMAGQARERFDPDDDPDDDGAEEGEVDPV